MALFEHTFPMPEQMLAETDSADSRAAFRRKTILLAEDNDDLRYVLKCSLEAMGYNVCACQDAHLALLAYQSQHAVDILLTDYEMPGKTGVELARELTALRRFLPVIVLTGSMLAADVMQEIHDRHWVFVSKPCQLSALDQVIRKLTRNPADLPALVA